VPSPFAIIYFPAVGIIVITYMRFVPPWVLHQRCSVRSGRSSGRSLSSPSTFDLRRACTATSSRPSLLVPQPPRTRIRVLAIGSALGPRPGQRWLRRINWACVHPGGRLAGAAWCALMVVAGSWRAGGKRETRKRTGRDTCCGAFIKCGITARLSNASTPPCVDILHLLHSAV
jgi:hypothetical protein